MKSISIYGNNISFQFNAPLAETNFTSENFDLSKKSAYVTIGIQYLLNTDNEFDIDEIYSKILTTISLKAKTDRLDYLQNISINGTEVWCIDNGSNICLMTKEEY